MSKPLVIIDGSGPGPKSASAVLWRLGIDERLGATSIHAAGDVATQIAGLVAEGKLPIVLAPACDVALSAARAVAGNGRAGLAYIDGHTDFRHDENIIPYHRASRSELAELVGRRSDGATLAPHFRDEDTATIGFKHNDDAFLELRKTAILLWPMYWLYEHSRIDLEQSLQRRFDRAELDAIWIHLDLDALDPKLLPDVATPIDDGLSVNELVPILRTILATGKAVGMSISNLTPGLLADGNQAQIVADALTRAFGTDSEAEEL
jgi:arginase